MTINIDLLELLFSAGFVLLGAIAFNIASIISGYNIYRELDVVESTILSLSFGIIIFLLSPISFIILQPSDPDFNTFLCSIAKYKVLFPFIISSVGLGLIFGAFCILNPRISIIDWITNKFGIPYLVKSYSTPWHHFFCSIKYQGLVKVCTKKDKLFNGTLIYWSLPKYPKEIVLESTKNNDRILIVGDEIRYIWAPQESFEKHYEVMRHVGQAVYCVLISIGIYFMAISCYFMEIYAKDSCFDCVYIYEIIKKFFLILSAIILASSIWVAKKDYNNPKSYVVLCPECICFPLIILNIYYIIIKMEHNVATLISFLIIIVIIIIYSMYRRKRENILDNLIDHNENGLRDLKLIKKILTISFSNLCYNDEEKAHLDRVKTNIINEFSDEDHQAVEEFIDDIINKLKDINKIPTYLGKDEINLIRLLIRHMKRVN